MSWLLIFPAALILAGFVLWHLLDWWINRPLTPTDRECERVDRELDEFEIEHRPGGGWTVRGTK